MLPLVGCIDDNSVCPDDSEVDPKDGITLEFSLKTRTPVKEHSRALIEPTNTQLGTEVENYLDLDNLLFLLFDDEQKLLQIFSPYIELVPGSSYVKYKVTAFLSNHYFLRTTKQELTFTIVVLGNYSRLSPQSFSYAPGMKLADVLNKAGTFAIPVRNNNSSTWIPSIYAGENGQQPGYIPMSGMQTFKVNVADLKASSPGNPYQLSTDENGKDINMLRALAKIEIVDQIAYTAGTPAASSSNVEKVELVGHTTRGSILPTFNQWTISGVETQYVTQTSVPPTASYIGINPVAGGFAVTDESNLLNFFEDEEATRLRGDGCKVFSCYLTEYDPAGARAQNVPNMWMRVTVQTPDGSGAAKSKFYRLEVAPYTDSQPGANMPILRNNIYRYAITGISATADLRLIVDDWDLDETTWNYNDNPGIAEGGYMKWYDAAGNEIMANTTTARLTVTYNNPVTGTFTFSEPLDATWKVAFANMGETETDAFKFVVGKNEAGTDILADECSGIINGRQASVTIVATRPATLYPRTARLIFTVETLDGRVLSADVVGTEYGNNQYFTIYQEESL